MTTIDAGADADKVSLPRTERPDAPAYLQRYHERQARTADPLSTDDDDEDSTPLYLRRFRERRVDKTGLDAPVPLWEGAEVNATRAWAEVTRTREIVPDSKDQLPAVATDIYLIRHGETQGYSTESGLTPLGAWQSHRRGQELARRVMTGHRVTMGCANTNRARQTAEGVRRGMLDQMVLFGRDAEISEIQAYEEFRNFQVATPDGFRDVTQAFRQYHSIMEMYERVGDGGRPQWLVDVDRFWGIQQAGGDPITHWLTMPMLSFEPPVACVRRFWAGILRMHTESPGQALIVATHSGPIRAFATWAMGYDPGEPHNTEFVRVRILADGQSAMVLYRNRVQEVAVPDLDDFPDWWAGLEGRAVPKSRREAAK